MKNPKTFKLYVKLYNEDNVLLENESGFICLHPNTHLETLPTHAMIFTEKEEGHGSKEDWINFFKDENPYWENIIAV